MHVSDRFGELWRKWDASVRERADIPAFLARATDEDLVELLAGASAADRKYERDIVATEIVNRLGRRHRDLPAAADQVLRSAEIAYEAAAEGQRAIHTAEGILKATGETELGAEVSASAYASLDTTRVAFEAAQKNSADVQATVSQSRIAKMLAEDAGRSAEKTADATEAAMDHLESIGHHKEASAARQAASEMLDAADDTIEATRVETDAVEK